MQRVVVIGLGKLGLAIARTLTEQRVDVVGIDRSMALVQEASTDVAACVQADATDLKALDASGVRGASCAMVAIGEDFEASVLSTAVLRELGIPKVVARANNEREARILRLVGATDIVYVEQEMGKRLAHSLIDK